jgi:hypothetical protein
MSLVELADRMVNRGVVLRGDATISVAGVDLIYLGLNVLLTSIETFRQGGADRAPAEGSGEPAAHPRDWAG